MKPITQLKVTFYIAALFFAFAMFALPQFAEITALLAGMVVVGLHFKIESMEEE